MRNLAILALLAGPAAAAWTYADPAPAVHAPAQAPAANAARPAPAANTANAATAAGQTPLKPQQVLDHIRRTISWYRHVELIQQLPEFADDPAARQRLQQAALKALQLAFVFGRAAAALLEPQNPTASAVTPQSSQSSLEGALARINQRVSALQGELADLDGRLARAHPRERSTLKAQRDEVSAALNLAREVQDTVRDLLQFQSSTAVLGGARGLLGEIQDLQRTVPEAVRASALRRTGIAGGPGGGTSGSGASDSSAGSSGGGPGASGTGTSGGAGTGSGVSAPAAPAAVPQASFRPESAGVFALAGEWLSLQNADSQIDGALRDTAALVKELDTLRPPLLAQARQLANTGVDTVNTSDPAQLAALRGALEDAATRFRGLSTLLVPLGEQAIVIDDARTTITNWNNQIRSRAATALRYLLIHAAGLGTGIIAVLIISDVWRRATFRYLHDSRRRRQFLTLRRIVVAIALIIIIIFGLISEVGSLATYIGFVTAGLAVALQNVILAVVAYFYLIGRYGVSVGDRITLTGVTGRVVEIGLLRIYLTELTGADLHSTGRMIVLSNSVIFQPQAMFKQIPGADYLWHTVSLTLAASVDAPEAEKRIKTAADSVFAHYRENIERQHAVLQQLTGFETAAPATDIRSDFVEKGLRVSVRYPVQGREAAAVDQAMIRTVREAIAKDPPLELAAGGAPTVELS